MKKALIKILAVAFICALLSTALFTAVSVKNTPVASASYIGDNLTGCGTKTATMKQNAYNKLGQRLFTVKITREWDYCRVLHCEYFHPVPCYWGQAPISSTVFGRPSISTTNLAIGWDLITDSVTGQWKDHIEGGDWGYHSEIDTFMRFHVKQCFGVGPVSICGTRGSFSWKLAVDGSGQAHGDYKWGG